MFASPMDGAKETSHIKYLTTVDKFQEKNDVFGLRDEESLWKVRFLFYLVLLHLT